MTQQKPDVSTVVRLALSESKGAIPGGWREDTAGHAALTADWGTVCPGCDKIPAKGEKITRIFHAWYHANCGAAYLRSTAADEAWLALAHQLERSPSKFTNPETKAITRNLLRIAGRTFTIPDEGYGDSVHGRRVQAKQASGEGTQFADVIGGYNDDDLRAAVREAEQLSPDVAPSLIGLRAWAQLDAEQQARHLPELLAAYVEVQRVANEL